MSNTELNRIRKDDPNFPPDDLRNQVGLLEVRTAPYTSTIIVDSHPFEVWIYRHGVQVPGAPEGWTFLGCPLALTREPGESDKSLLTRANLEAEAILNDGFYRNVEY